MSFTRIYQNTLLAVNATLQLDVAASHHLARVLRKEINDDIILFNGLGAEYLAKITQIQKNKITVSILAENKRNVETMINIYLAQGIAKGDKMDFIVQKAVELGVKKIFPLVTERCNVRLPKEREEKRLQHWQSIVISACEQSGRNIIPEVFKTQTLSSLLETTAADLKLILSPHCQTKFQDNKFVTPSSILLLIGPEGGFSDQEMNQANTHHCLPVKLGERVLRTETATIAAITAVLCRFGEF